MPSTFTLPVTRHVGDIDPPGDMNNVVAAVGVAGATFNVMNAAYAGGADPTGASDSTAAIQAALNACPFGGEVLLPAGTYQTTGPLTIPPQVSLTGPHGSHIDATSCAIKPAASFSGAAVILVVDQSTGGYSVTSNQQRLSNVTLDCSSLPGSTIDGIQSQGLVHGVILDDVQIRNAPNHGIACVTNGSGVAFSWRGFRVVANTCGSHGFSPAITDSTWVDCEAIGCAGNGLNLSGWHPIRISLVSVPSLTRWG